MQAQRDKYPDTDTKSTNDKTSAYAVNISMSNKLLRTENLPRLR